MTFTAVALLEYYYSQAPIPPGVDPGHWIASGYVYIGHARPPSSAVGNPYIYPPIAPAFVGLMFLIAGNPTDTAYLAGGMFLLLLGVSLAWVVRRFYRSAPIAFAVLGAGLFGGTTLSMLFWGAYPNFLGFTLLNLLFLATWRFLSRDDWRDGAILGALLGAIYLTHTLVFTVAVAGVLASGGLILILYGPRTLGRLLVRAGAPAALAVAAGIIGVYAALLRVGGVAFTNYLGNPASYSLDGLGLIFVPLGTGPELFPPGAALYLSADSAAAILLLGALGVLVIGGLYRRWFGVRADARYLVIGGEAIAAMGVPVAGWAAHLSTDYTRFVYFLPLPLLLLAGLLVEAAVVRRDQRTPSPSASAGPPLSPRGRAVPGSGWAYALAAAFVIILVLNVSVPMGEQQEATDAGASHSSQFLAAAQWIAGSSTPGNVLTIQPAARWTEALTDRGAFDAGPTWLDFEPGQVLLADESYWALGCAYAVTGNGTVLSYTPAATSLLAQDPMYSVYVDGVIVPIVRFLPGAMSVSVVDNGVTQTVPGASFGPATFSIDPVTGDAVSAYSTSLFNLSIGATVSGTAAAQITVVATPGAGVAIESVQLAFASPPRGSAIMGAPPAVGGSASGAGIAWSTTRTIGPLPNPITLATSIAVEPAVTNVTVRAFPVNMSVLATVNNPVPSSPLRASVQLTTQGTGEAGIPLPRVMGTEAFLQANSIHFLLLPNANPYSAIALLYETQFGFQDDYSNSLWQVLQG